MIYVPAPESHSIHVVGFDLASETEILGLTVLSNKWFKMMLVCLPASSSS